LSLLPDLFCNSPDWCSFHKFPTKLTNSREATLIFVTFVIELIEETHLSIDTDSAAPNKGYNCLSSAS
jgi:hypothetical protein